MSERLPKWLEALPPAERQAALQRILANSSTNTADFYRNRLKAALNRAETEAT